MYHCSVHTKTEILATLREYDVKIIIFPPHMTQVFQTLDLGLSGLFERKMQYKLPFVNDGLTVRLFKTRFTHRSKHLVPIM
jgi:hypothetical protein